jgi:hypothetical protein
VQHRLMLKLSGDFSLHQQATVRTQDAPMNCLSTPGGKSVHIAEMAHVFAANDTGPRANPDLSLEERGAFENLVMLCANCHTMVDKAPRAFPEKTILQRKREHASRLQELFGAVKFDDRPSAREIVEPLLAENHAIFKHYGHHIDSARNPESGAAEQWKRKILACILSNNRLLAPPPN